MLQFQSSRGAGSHPLGLLPGSLPCCMRHMALEKPSACTTQPAPQEKRWLRRLQQGKH